MRMLPLVLGVCAPAICVGAATADRAKPLDALSRCRAVAEAGSRLACYDKAAAALDEAEQNGAVVVADREQIRKKRRDDFGLSSGDPLPDKVREPPVQRVESTLAAASFVGYKWTLTLANGMRWRQVDGQTLIAPRRGARVVVTRATMGGYFLKVGDDSAIRAVRAK